MRRVILIVVAFVAVVGLFGIFQARTALAGYLQSGNRNSSASRAFYSKDQARRGKELYGQHCATCHQADLKGKCPDENVAPGSRYVCATVGTSPPLVGEAFKERWYSVNDLYGRIRWSQPADNQGALSPAVYADILAYLLEANGYPAGKADLKTDRKAMKSMTLWDRPKTSVEVAPFRENSELPPPNVARAYYTEAQAKRGKPLFYGSCGACHTADPNGPNGRDMPHSSGLGWYWGEHRFYLVMAGEPFLTSASGIAGKPQRWATVADLYNKVSTAQPAHDVAGMNQESYVDIMAFLLQAGGFPAGKEELPLSEHKMRNMSLEKDFVPLFNGKDLTGWGFLLGGNCAPRPEGCGQTNPGETFSVEDGMIYDTGTPHGYMYPNKKYQNFDFRTDYRYQPYEGMEEDDQFYANTGYLLFITKHHVWPRTLEIQGKTNFEMAINLMGDGRGKFTYDDATRMRVRKPAGQWNSVQIVSRDGQVWNYLNGSLISHVTEHYYKDPGYIGIQAESGGVHFRSIRIKEF